MFIQDSGDGDKSVVVIMTRVARNRILKDANGDIGDHLRNHIHLTNCIHLKNHMHKQSPVLTDRALMRDLIVLQRSRSLRDPSASPPAWHSPSVVDLLPKKGDSNNDSGIREGRRSVDHKSSRRLSGLGGSSPVVNFGTSKVTPSEGFDGMGPVNEESSESGGRDGSRRVKREESSRKSYRAEEALLRDNKKASEIYGAVSGNSGSKEKGSRASGRLSSRLNEAPFKTLSDQLNEAGDDSDDVVSSNVRPRMRYGGDVNRGSGRPRRRRFRGTRRVRAPVKDSGGGKSEMSVASNSLPQGSGREKYGRENEEEDEEEGEEGYGDRNMSRAPQKGCGIPFNWSRIHHRGKTFLDKAGRSFSCGMSEPRMRKGGSQPRDGSDLPMPSDDTSSFTKSDAEALPLLVDSADNNEGWAHDYSGELGIFADNLLKNDDSDLASEARSGGQHKKSIRNGRRHQSLTQKYMPLTFQDLVGQNLVVQALSNAVSRRKVGLLYVFYGPHGTGKTSCARIFARALNCQSVERPKPCGFCSSCVSYDTGKSRNIREVGPVGNFNFEGIMDLLDNMMISQLPTQHRVFIFDDCDTLSSDCWSAISKVVDRSPRRLVFILVCSSLDVLPHMIISRCHKFFFPKLKDPDIISTLQWIASKEDTEIDKDALKLIASRSDGSLRDAEMTLEQLCLLGQRISVPLVQELVGLISDEKLVDLLDLALSADTVNTVKNLRIIMESGVEPLALMSQLATVITDILAGCYDFAKDHHKRKFFRRLPLSKVDMEKLRLALKTLSEAEKQLRVSNDKLTWLTAALLQLAPDQQYLLPSSSADTSRSPLALDNTRGGENSDHHHHHHHQPDPSGESTRKGLGMDRRSNAGAGGSIQTRDVVGMSTKPSGPGGKNRPAVEEIWLEVIEKVHVNGLREFLYKEGKIVSVNLGTAPTVQLTFSSPLAKSTAEKFRGHVLQAFEAVLGSPVTIEIRCVAKKDGRSGSNPQPLSLPPPIKDNNGSSSRVATGQDFNSGRSEIVEVAENPKKEKVQEVNSSYPSARARRRHLEASQRQSQSIVRGKVSLAHVIQQAEGCSRQNGWSKRKAVSIAEKLEQENLRLEPRSRSLLCWKASRATRRKLSRLKVRTRRAPPDSLLKLISCGKCLSTRSPR